MAQSVIGAQLYTLRDHLKTPPEMAKTLARVRKMGYEAVQVSGLGAVETKELAKMLDGEGLACAATHVGLDLMKDVAKCADYHHTLKCSYTAIGGFGWDDPKLAVWKQFAADYSVIARALEPEKIYVGYHNHSHELCRISDAPLVSPLELLLKECEKSVWFEIDTYWITHGGGDPAAYIERVAGRIPCVHFKDMGINGKREQFMTEVGSGNLNWPRIIESCKKAGVKWYLVERDAGLLDPFDSLKISLDNLRAMGLH